MAIHYFLRTSSGKAECEALFEEVVEEVCQEFRSGRVIGELCPDLCTPEPLLRDGSRWEAEPGEGDGADAGVGRQEGAGRGLRLIDCPDQGWHGGKEIVVSVTWRRRKLVMKGKKASIRSLMLDLPVRHGAIHQRVEDYYAAVVNDSLAAVTHADQEISQNIHHLTPWQEDGLAWMNRSSWRTLSLLSQDPEFLMTRLMHAIPVPRPHRLHDQLFPFIASSCGHLYVSEYADQILDSSFVVPSVVPFVSRSVGEKIDAGIKLIQFLIRFTNQAGDRELCDVKLNQFAVFSSSDQVLLIDSDMIYTKDFVRTSLQAMHSCKSNHECNFFDCNGLCIPSPAGEHLSICILDDEDNNLRRICRNVIFPFPFNLFGFRQNLFGLLSDLASNEFGQEISQIQQLCESSSNITMLPNANEILQVMEGIQKKIKKEVRT